MRYTLLENTASTSIANQNETRIRRLQMCILPKFKIGCDSRFTWNGKMSSEEWVKRRLPESPRSPFRVMNTFASVEAAYLSPVVTRTWYRLTAIYDFRTTYLITFSYGGAQGSRVAEYYLKNSQIKSTASQTNLIWVNTAWKVSLLCKNPTKKFTDSKLKRIHFQMQWIWSTYLW